MENTQTQAPIAPTTQDVAVSPVTTPPVEQPKKKSPFLLGVVIVVLLIVVSLLAGYFSSKRYQESTTNPDGVSISPTSVPVANKDVNPIATSSAFLGIEESIASLSSRIAGFNPIDPQVAPPVLDLPLGFSN